MVVLYQKTSDFSIPALGIYSIKALPHYLWVQTIPAWITSRRGSAFCALKREDHILTALVSLTMDALCVKLLK